MENLEVKQIDFLGNTLMAAQDADGTIWAGIRWLCDGIGFTEGQRKRQMANIQADRVLSKGGSNLILNGTGYGNRDVFCLKLDFVPMWLAKINITPTMESETPDVADKLETYQLKAKDVLAAAFMPIQRQASTAEIVSMMAQNNVEFERKLLALESQATTLATQTATVQHQLHTLTRNNPAYWRADMESRIAEIAAIYNTTDLATRSKLYVELEEAISANAKHRVDLANRLTRLRNRTRERGSMQRDCAKLTKLDVIGSDTTLRRKFEEIVEEYRRIPEQVSLSGLRR